MSDYIMIDLDEYDANYNDLVDWAKVSGIDVWAISSIGYNRIRKLYAVKTPEDLTAFKLRFAAKQQPLERYVLPDFFDNGDAKSNFF